MGMSDRPKMLACAMGLIVAVIHFGYGQTNSTNAGSTSLAVTNHNPLTPNPTAITDLDGTTYKSIRILKVEPDGLMIEYAPPAGGIGLKKLWFVNLSTELQLKYGYDAQKAAEYKAAQATGEARLRKEMQVQQEQAWAAERARAEDNLKGRLEIDRQAEAARIQAEKERAARIKEEAERNKDAYSVGTGLGRRAGRGSR